MYVELHARSAFSFLEGASLPEVLMARAAALDMPAMALLDRNGLYGAPRFHLAGRRAAVRAHIGAEIAVRDFPGANERLRPPEWLPHAVPAEPVRLALLAETQQGYQNLSRLVTRFKLREPTKAEGAALVHDVAEHAAGLVCLTGGDEGPLAAALNAGGLAAVGFQHRIVAGQPSDEFSRQCAIFAGWQREPDIGALADTVQQSAITQQLKMPG